MNLAQLKAAFHDAWEKDDEDGETVLRPDFQKRKRIFARVVKLLSEEPRESQEGDNPDFESAAELFLDEGVTS
jgi:hypothetical protein